MKFRYEIGRIGDIGGGFPRVFGCGVALPFNEILQTIAEKLRIEDLFDLKLLFVVDDDGRRRRLRSTGDVGFVIPIE